MKSFCGGRNLNIESANYLSLYSPAYGLCQSQVTLYQLWMDHKMDEVNFQISNYSVGKIPYAI
jgi:hypothetical protein